MTFQTLTLILFLLGFVPHHVSRRILRSRRKGRRYVVRYQVYAIFWRLTVDCPRGGRATWRLSVPLIRRLADAVWAAVRKLLD